eukprot:1185171-Prorocentrum_minimum.AAC.1
MFILLTAQTVRHHRLIINHRAACHQASKPPVRVSGQPGMRTSPPHEPVVWAIVHVESLKRSRHYNYQCMFQPVRRVDLDDTVVYSANLRPGSEASRASLFTAFSL